MKKVLFFIIFLISAVTGLFNANGPFFFEHKNPLPRQNKYQQQKIKYIYFSEHIGAELQEDGSAYQVIAVDKLKNGCLPFGEKNTQVMNDKNPTKVKPAEFPSGLH
jgi:hypothetical protein